MLDLRNKQFQISADIFDFAHTNTLENIIDYVSLVKQSSLQEENMAPSHCEI